MKPMTDSTQRIEISSHRDIAATISIEIIEPRSPGRWLFGEVLD
jgi:hypothetical protein